jgi:hypothetical protein
VGGRRPAGVSRDTPRSLLASTPYSPFATPSITFTFESILEEYYDNLISSFLASMPYELCIM